MAGVASSGPAAGTSRRLLIIQPYIPSYRAPLFTELRKLLAVSSIDLAVASATASGVNEGRGDDLTHLLADFVIPETRRHFLGREAIRRDVDAVVRGFDPGWIIVEQAIKNLESWPLVLRQGRGRHPRVAMWGQGRSYSTGQSRPEAWAKQWMTRRADWFFAYTQAGRDHVVNQGFPPARTTVLRNSTDTRTLKHELGLITEEELAEFRQAHRLAPERTALFLGGVDDRKGIPFLIEAAQMIGQALPEFRLLVAGTGSSMDLVRDAENSGIPVVALGRVDGPLKALVLRAADIVMVPEWVGLVAVDALTAGLPVVTTMHDSHSPEIEYLVEAGTAVITGHTTPEYASEVAELLLHRERRARLRERAERVASEFSIETMAGRFADGITAWMSTPHRP